MKNLNRVIGLLSIVMLMPQGHSSEVFSEKIMQFACRTQIEAEEFPSACFFLMSRGTSQMSQKLIKNEIALSCLRAHNKSDVPLGRIKSYLSLPNLPEICRRELEVMRTKGEYRTGRWNAEAEPP